jgi:hypothetical protein
MPDHLLLLFLGVVGKVLLNYKNKKFDNLFRAQKTLLVRAKLKEGFDSNDGRVAHIQKQ